MPHIHLRSKFSTLTYVALFSLLICLMTSLSAEIKVTTRFEPARIALGDTAKYIVEITETDSNSMPQSERVTSLPIQANAGLTLRNGRTSTNQQTQFTNGRSEYTITQQLIIDASASRTGSYPVSAYEFEYKGTRQQAPQATLTVIERGADATPPVDELIFLKAATPAQLYVGQTSPVTLKLYLSDSVRLSGLNAFDRSADGFTMSDLPDESTESAETVNGRLYRVLSWPMSITPISAGPQDLNFQFTISAQMPDKRGNQSPLISRSPFGSSIIDDFFGRSGRTERFNIFTQPKQIEVLPLPSVGKPKNFSGAVGDFGMQVYSDTQVTQVGEPIMLSLKITGRGNFDRIKGPEISTGSNWRHYKPEAFFESEDPLKIKGSKRFDYVFIAETPGTHKLPEVRFSFFDPDAAKYVLLTSPEIQVKVAPSGRRIAAPQATSQPPVQETLEPEISNAITLSPEEALLTLDYRPQPARHVDMDMQKKAWFLILNFAAFSALIGTCIALIKRRRLRESGHYALIHQASKDLKAALAATKNSDAETFYRNAQEAIRLAATIRTARNLRSADLTQLEQEFEQLGLSESVNHSARALYQAADNHRFSGQSASIDLTHARTQLHSILKAL